MDLMEQAVVSFVQMQGVGVFSDEEGVCLSGSANSNSVNTGHPELCNANAHAPHVFDYINLRGTFVSFHIGKV